MTSSWCEYEHENIPTLYFVYNNLMIISLSQIESTNGRICRMTTRDSTGKYTWDFNVNQFKDALKQINSIAPISIPSSTLSVVQPKESISPISTPNPMVSMVSTIGGIGSIPVTIPKDRSSTLTGSITPVGPPPIPPRTGISAIKDTSSGVTPTGTVRPPSKFIGVSPFPHKSGVISPPPFGSSKITLPVKNSASPQSVVVQPSATTVTNTATTPTIPTTPTTPTNTTTQPESSPTTTTSPPVTVSPTTSAQQQNVVSGKKRQKNEMPKFNETKYSDNLDELLA
jgi:hypothetical protein